MTAAPEAGQVLKGYQIEQELGIGGFGAVYRAYQEVIGREVAIKMILPQYASHPRFIRSFETEAQLVARLEHPHIVPLFDYWRDPSGAYIVMRYLRGGSLLQLLRQEQLSLERIATLLDQITAALHIAHRNKVIHRDIKPANILLDEDGNAYLSDFGIAATTDSVSEDDTVSGSIAYMAPEQLGGDAPSPASDIYSLGFLLYEMLVGRHPFGDLSPGQMVQKHIGEPVPDPSDLRPDLPTGLYPIIQLATAKQPRQRYADVRLMSLDFQRVISNGSDSASATQEESRGPLLPETPLSAAETLLDAPNFETDDDFIVQTQATGIMGAGEWATAFIKTAEIENPYKGLRPFQEADAADFFGREQLVEHLLAQLASGQRFMAVVGPSGSGKSSVVRAGLLPALREGGIEGSENWFIVDMLPGNDPVQHLHAALLSVAVNPPESLLDSLQNLPDGLLGAGHSILAQLGGGELLLVIDQFEEIFTQLESEAERIHFLELLRIAVTSPDSPLRIIITLRADFYDRPLLYEHFGALIQQHTEVILPLSTEELEAAVVGPAQRVGVGANPDLVASIVADVREEPGALPLLQYALREIFEQRQGRYMTLHAYQDSGGVLGALARRADEVYQKLDGPQQEAAEQLFLRLVSLGEGVEDTRRRAQRAELSSITADKGLIQSVLDAFGQYRLLTFDQDRATREPTVEVAHEALLRTWGRLREWISASRDDIRLQRLLAAAAAEWEKNGRIEDYLLYGARLTQFEDWAGRTRLALTREEEAYLKASLAERERLAAKERERQEYRAALERRSRNLLRSLAVVFGVAAAIGIGLALLAVNQSRIAIDAQRAAEDNYVLALSNADTATFALGDAEQQAIIAGNNAATATFAQGDAQRQANIAETQVALVSTEQYRAEFQAALAGTQAALAVNNAATATFAQGDAYIQAERAQTQAAIAAENAATATFAQGAAQQQANIAETQVALVSTAQFRAEVEANNAGTQAALAEQSAATATVAQGAAQQQANIAQTQVALVSTAQSRAEVEANNAGTQAVRAENNAATATIAQGQAITEAEAAANARIEAERQADIANSLALVANAEQALTNDVSIGLVLALAAYSSTDNPSAQVQRVLAETAYQAPRFRFEGGHQGRINSAEISPDSRYILSGAEDGSVCLWSLVENSLLYCLRWHNAAVNDVDFSPDGTRALSVSDDSTMLIWETPSGEFVDRYRWQAVPILSGVFVSNTEAAVGTENARLLVWDLTQPASQNAVRVFERDSEQITVSQDGSTLLTAGRDYAPVLTYWQTRFWQEVSLTRGEMLNDPLLLSADHSIPGLDFFAHDIALNPNGSLALTAGRGDRDFGTTPVLWDVERRRILAIFEGHDAPAQAVDFGPDGSTAISGSDDFSMILWRVPDGTVLRRFRGHTKSISVVDYSSDGRYALSASTDGVILVWDMREVQLEATYQWENGYNASSLAFAPDGAALLLGSSDEADSRYFTTLPPSGEPALSFSGALANFSQREAAPLWLAFLPDGQRAVSVTPMLVRTWNLATGFELTRRNLGVFTPRAAALSPDGQQVAIAGGELLRLQSNGENIQLSFGQLELFDLENNRSLWVLNPNSPSSADSPLEVPSPLNAVAFSPNGQEIAAAADDQTIKIYSTEDGAPLRELSGGHSNPILALAFNADGRYLLTGSADNVLVLWDYHQGQVLRQFTGHLNDVTALAFHPQEALVASGDASGRLLLWDISSGQIVRRFNGHRSATNQVLFDPSGRYLLSLGLDGAVHWWRLDLGDDLLNWTRANRVIPALTPLQCEQFNISALCEQTVISVEESPTPSPTPAAQDIMLSYDPRSFLLTNSSNRTLDIRGLSFAYVSSSGQSRLLEAGIWFDSGPISRVPPNTCYQVVTDERFANQVNFNCTRPGWRIENDLDSLVWLYTRPQSEFQVLLNGEAIANCPIDAGRCSFNLPQ